MRADIYNADMAYIFVDSGYLPRYNVYRLWLVSSALTDFQAIGRILRERAAIIRGIAEVNIFLELISNALEFLFQRPPG